MPILCLEDSKTLRRLIEEATKDMELRLVMAEAWQKAFELDSRYRFRAYILDWNVNETTLKDKIDYLIRFGNKAPLIVYTARDTCIQELKPLQVMKMQASPREAVDFVLELVRQQNWPSIWKPIYESLANRE